MKVSTLMTRDVVTVTETATVEEMARLLVRHRIGTLPVVDSAGRVLGVIRRLDLSPRDKHIPFSMELLPALFGEPIDLCRLDEAYSAARERTARELMTNAHCIDANADLGAAARLLMHVAGALPVVSNDKLVGVLSHSDLLRLLTESDRWAA